MEFDDVIKIRTATRKFSNKKVDKETIKKILSAGILAPTAKNLQPEKIFVLQSREAKKKVDKLTPCRYNAPVCMLVCADKDIVWQKGDYSTLEMDATIVATHLILEATNLGVDSVWVRNFEPKQAQKEFNLGENVIPICMIQLGYRAPDCPNNPMHNKRKNIEEVVKFL